MQPKKIIRSKIIPIPIPILYFSPAIRSGAAKRFGYDASSHKLFRIALGVVERYNTIVFALYYPFVFDVVYRPVRPDNIIWITGHLSFIII
jgi:hypothetical protein